MSEALPLFFVSAMGLSLLLYVILDGFDLAASAERQKTFLWQVSGDAFKSDAFLVQAVENYGRFLWLMRLHPDIFLVPTYQVIHVSSYNFAAS